LLPYYKYLSKQPYEFYENEDVENLRMLTQIKEDTRKLPIQKNDIEGGD